MVCTLNLLITPANALLKHEPETRRLDRDQPHHQHIKDKHFAFPSDTHETTQKAIRYHEGRAGPGHGGESAEIRRLTQHIQLLLPDLQDLLLEGHFPGVELQHLYTVENLVHQLDAVVLMLHLLHLCPPMQRVLMHILNYIFIFILSIFILV